MKLYRVHLSSEDFGDEYFEYNTLYEARQNFKQIVRESKRAAANDSVDRQITLMEILDQEEATS